MGSKLVAQFKALQFLALVIRFVYDHKRAGVRFQTAFAAT